VNRTAFINCRNTTPNTDPTFSSNTLLLMANGANDSQVITDSSNYGHAVTTLGNTKITNTRNPFGSGNSIYFDGASDYLMLPQYPYTADPLGFFGFDDFMIDGWLYCEDVSLDNPIMGGILTWASNLSYVIRINANVMLFFVGFYDATRIEYSVAGMDNTWFHFEVNCTAGITRLFINGVQVGTYSTAKAANNGTTSPDFNGLGCYPDNPTASGTFKGNMAYIRMKKGVGGHTANFSVPTAPPPTS